MPRNTTIIVCAASILGTVSSVGVANAEEIRYIAATGTFDPSGPEVIEEGTMLDVQVDDSDMRQIWSVSTQYEHPRTERVAEALQILQSFPPLANVTRPQVAGTDDVEAARLAVQDATQSTAAVATSLKSQLKRPLTAPQVTQLETALLAARADITAARSLLAAARPVASPEQRDRVLDKGEEQLSLAEDSLSAIESVLEFLKSSPQSRHQRVRVRSGYESLILRLCVQRVQAKGDGFEITAAQCSSSSYEVAVLKQGAGPLIGAGLIVPFYIPRRSEYRATTGGIKASDLSHIGNPQPALFLGAEYTFSAKARAHVSVDLGLGLGEDIGRFYSAGLGFGAYGVHLSAGGFLNMEGRQVLVDANASDLKNAIDDRPSGGLYAGLSLTTEIFDLLKKKDAAGATNVPMPPNASAPENKPAQHSAEPTAPKPQQQPIGQPIQ